jgi:hypothetical protein
MKVFNKSLGRTIASLTSVTGSCGHTIINAWLTTGQQLSFGLMSNYAYTTPIIGDARFNKMLLKQAPVGTVLTATHESNWSDAEPSNWFSKWEKIPSGAWIQIECSEDESLN